MDIISLKSARDMPPVPCLEVPLALTLDSAQLICRLRLGEQYFCQDFL